MPIQIIMIPVNGYGSQRKLGSISGWESNLSIAEMLWIQWLHASVWPSYSFLIILFQIPFRVSGCLTSEKQQCKPLRLSGMLYPVEFKGDMSRTGKSVLFKNTSLAMHSNIFTNYKYFINYKILYMNYNYRNNTLLHNQNCNVVYTVVCMIYWIIPNELACCMVPGF